MIELIMYFGIGFLVAALLGLLFIPLVHNRAVRLTMKRSEASTPLSITEIRADKDQLRAEFAMSTRRLEMKIDKLKAQTMQLAELGKKADAINQLKKELTEKNLTNVALEARTKSLRDQLCATEEELQMKSNALLQADRQLADNQAELAKMGRTRQAIASRQLILIFELLRSRLVQQEFQRREFKFNATRKSLYNQSTNFLWHELLSGFSKAEDPEIHGLRQQSWRRYV